MKSKKWLVGVFIIGLAIIGLSFLNLGDNLVYFYTPAEAVAQASDLSGREIRVGAMVKPGTVEWDADNLVLKFIATDMKEHEILVTHQGTKPDMFKENQGVVVEGKILAGGKEMQSRNLYVKHSEEYKKPDDHASMDQEYLQKSIFKNEKVTD